MIQYQSFYNYKEGHESRLSAPLFGAYILDNYSGKKGTFIASLNDESCFHTDLFWELYKSIAALAEHKLYSEELSVKISSVYQRMLKEMIWHFSPTDNSVIANMPENYDDYIERMDSAVEAYMHRTGMPDEEVFELRKPDSGLKY